MPLKSLKTETKATCFAALLPNELLDDWKEMRNIFFVSDLTTNSQKMCDRAGDIT